MLDRSEIFLQISTSSLFLRAFPIFMIPSYNFFYQHYCSGILFILLPVFFRRNRMGLLCNFSFLFLPRKVCLSAKAIYGEYLLYKKKKNDAWYQFFLSFSMFHFVCVCVCDPFLNPSFLVLILWTKITEKDEKRILFWWTRKENSAFHNLIYFPPQSFYSCHLYLIWYFWPRVIVYSLL